MPPGPRVSALLDIYEQGMAASPAVRAGLLAQAGGRDADATLGDADRAAWGFLSETIGGAHDAIVACAVCGEEVEFTLPEGFAPPDASTGPEATLRVRHKGRDFDLRLPRLSDIGARGLDLRRLCPDGDWSDRGFRAACEAALLEADPALKLDLLLTCGACGAEQAPAFDVTGYVWARLEQAARTTVREVALLARAYGWSEAELTAMSGARRAIYLRELGE